VLCCVVLKVVLMHGGLHSNLLPAQPNLVGWPTPLRVS